MGERNLPVLVLQQIAVSALQHAGGAAAKARRVLAECVAAAAGLHADQVRRQVRNERVKEADGIAAAAHAGDERIRQTAFRFQNLTAGFIADER